MVDSKWKELWSNLPLFGKYALGGIGVLGALMILRDEDSNFKAEDAPEDEENLDEIDCSVCGRPYAMNKIGIGLIEHYLKESNFGNLGWKSKDNPDGVVRTARNLAGFELYQHGDKALEHYISEGKKSKVYSKTITLLRASIVPQIIVGDVMNFIDLLDIDKLTAFCIGFLHDGAYGGESQGREIIGEDLEEERVWYIEGSIELKFVYEEGINTLIRASYTNDPESPVIYLPPAKFIKRKPEDGRSIQ